jgi:hypothetical protein
MVDVAVQWKMEKMYQTYRTKLADKTNLNFSFDSPTYYIITTFPGYIVPITTQINNNKPIQN